MTHAKITKTQAQKLRTAAKLLHWQGVLTDEQRDAVEARIKSMTRAAPDA